ncbi:hypothetical protein [Tsuneonella sp. SYSU-LHT278]|uniref:hypothetical protein n=1 Tax=Tsuneonella sediminis TaxID=3416089 RepID=UPI003F78B8A9
MRRLAILVPLLLAASACGEAEPDRSLPPRDPQVAQALDDPLMTDPDLSSRNEAAAALRVESDASLPVLPTTPEAANAARSDAARIVGGADRLVPLGEPQGTGAPLAADAGPRQHLEALGAGARCLDALQASAIWAARMPEPMPIYPRGATLAAAGSDRPGCSARAVVFSTPVPPAEVLAFYAERGRKAGAAPRYLRAGTELQLRGSSRPLAYDVRVRTEEDRTLVRLATLER